MLGNHVPLPSNEVRDPAMTYRGDDAPDLLMARRLDDLLSDKYCANTHNDSDINIIETALIDC